MFTVALMLALTGVGLNHMAQADARLKNIVEKNNVKTEMAQIMQRALQERALSMHIIAVLSDDFLKDEEYQRFNAFGGEYTRAREILAGLAVSPEEKKVFAKILGLTRVAQPEAQKVMEMGLQGNNPDILDHIRVQTMPKQRLISEQRHTNQAPACSDCSRCQRGGIFVHECTQRDVIAGRSGRLC